MDDTKVFAVTAVLPLKIVSSIGFAVEVEFADDVPAILTFDGTLSGSEEALLMFATEYSH